MDVRLESIKTNCEIDLNQLKPAGWHGISGRFALLASRHQNKNQQTNQDVPGSKFSFWEQCWALVGNW